ncbi:MAG: hypothetical protein Kilf2KO_19820 [Rhodospirillales bacterium]
MMSIREAEIPVVRPRNGPRGLSQRQAFYGDAVVLARPYRVAGTATPTATPLFYRGQPDARGDEAPSRLKPNVSGRRAQPEFYRYVDDPGLRPQPVFARQRDHSAEPDLLPEGASLFRRVRDGLRAWRSRAETRRQLARIDGRLLSDIGYGTQQREPVALALAATYRDRFLRY